MAVAELRQANGRARPVTLVPLPVHGPVSGWPQQAGPGQSRTTAGEPGRWHADGDTVIRVLAAIVVLAVAAFAAIVSYTHIYELGRHHGQDGTAATLLPLSVDGLIAAASLVMLHAARRKLPVPRLARAMLATGVIMTVAANVIYGIPPGWIGPVVSALIGAAISAWPAVAFIGSVEMAVRFVRDARHDGVGGQDGTAVSRTRDTGRVMPVTSKHDKPGPDKTTDRQQGKPVPAKPSPAVTKQARAADVIRDNPGKTNEELAALAGCKVRTIQRARNGTAKTP